MDNNNKNKIRELAEILRMTSMVSNIGFTMVGCILTGFGLGLAIEHFIIKEKVVYFIIGGILLGVASGFLAVYKQIVKKML